MPTITQLPLDLGGNMPSNLRVNESHAIVVARNKRNRVIVPEFGAFFTEGATVRDANGVALVRHVNLEFTYHYEVFSELTGKGVCALMVITDPNLRAPFSITYQAVGGNFSLSVRELKDVLDYIEANPDKIKWEDIIDKPTAYNPEPHTNKYWQLIGLDTLVTNLNRLGDSFALGRKAVIDANRSYYDNYVTEIRAALAAYRARVYAHLEDVSNPHLTDKTKVGLSNINNWPLANLVQSGDPTINNRYQPIGGVYNQLIKESIPVLNAHISDKATLTKPDPHNVTLAQLNLYSSLEIETLFTQKLKKGVTAYNTNQLVGINYATLYANCRKNLVATNMAGGTRFTMNQLGAVPAGVPLTELALVGNNTYVKYVDLMKKFNDTSGTIIPLGTYVTTAEHVAAANAMIASQNLSEGTWFVGNYYKRYYKVSLHAPIVLKCVNRTAVITII